MDLKLTSDVISFCICCVYTQQEIYLSLLSTDIILHNEKTVCYIYTVSADMCGQYYKSIKWLPKYIIACATKAQTIYGFVLETWQRQDDIWGQPLYSIWRQREIHGTPFNGKGNNSKKVSCW